MYGLMQDRPLLISSLIEHGARFHPHSEIVTRLPEGPIRRSNWAEVHDRSKQVANALAALGITAGDRVGTLAWNTDRHLALYFGVSGSGAVLHTVNPRLVDEQLEYVINHAEDQVLFFDVSFAHLVAELAPRLKTVRAYVAMTDRAHMPGIDVPQLHCWDDVIAAQSSHYTWPEFDERTASSLCYTSGTTGKPKGVLYSHRSTVLHALMLAARDVLDLSCFSSVLVVVPMFHANAWGTPYAAPMVGAKLVFPGPRIDGASIYELIRDERVTASQGVPTVWTMLFDHLDKHPEIDPRALGLKYVGVAGSALSRYAIDRFERDFGADVVQAWGMTETSPLGVICKPLPKHAGLARDQLIEVKLKQGRGIWGVDLKIVDEHGEPLPWDGKAFGHLHVRGPWIAKGYFKAEDGAKCDAQGFFPTGDVATIDPDGYLQLVDRAKDVIKSGGEWISSIDLENVAASHPAVAEVAVIGVPHQKWEERPLLVAVLRPGCTVTGKALTDHMADKVAKWWLPDDVIFVDELPHGATGKVAKGQLRERYRDHLGPTVSTHDGA
ncbi:long-chain-fatty-acid--CoA ligase [Mycobacterium sp. 1245805.9]|uniref:long-chain-fatty-acid--CoA ligase n=1 Tax=Mycobacterium sp. 1245805.9 TaxID=1856862 RepID=UPI0008006FEC|nr:long-chain-fatty-acid--CoA ligase [Mycobacterium sp. 1245805.9]OBI84568.1 long-chain fatty acid--CoA ligase [Mycobacterium sp. 1245805.9]